MLLNYGGTRKPTPAKANAGGLELRQYAKKRMAALRADRDSGEWLTHWRDVSEYIMPRRGRFLLRDPRRGRKVNRNILSPVPFRAAEVFANGMNAGLTSKSRQWFNFTVEDRSLANIQAVRVWLSDCERLIMQWMDSSNLYQVLPEIYLELAVFGTSASVILEDFEKLFRIETLTIGEYVVACDMYGRPTTLGRDYTCTVEQLVEQFGLENCSLAVRDKHRNKEFAQTIDVCHLIEPNRDAKAGDKPFRSLYWEANCGQADEGRFLRIEGYSENPLLIPRWSVSGGDAYGRSLGMDALPEAKQLKQAIIRKEQGKERVTIPPMIAPASLKNAGANLLPQAINYLDSTDGQVFRSVYEKYDPRLELQMRDIQQLEANIRQIFYNDLLFAISQMDGVQPRNQLEIMERKDEKLQQLGSGVEGFETGFLEVLIDRIWNIAVRKGALPPPPAILSGKNVKTVFVGPLALAQKAQGIMSLERTIALIGSMARSFPEAGDKLNTDAAIDEYADLTNAPASMLRSDEDVAKLRRARQARADKEAIAANGPQAIQQIASGAELLSRTRSASGRTALQEVEEAAAGY
jgi:hypothetical protein